LDGEPSADRRGARRWVVPVDVESSRVNPPEPLGSADLSDRSVIDVCRGTGGDGWVLSMNWPNANIAIVAGSPAEPVQLRQVYARVRLWADRACLERVTGQTRDERVVNGRTEHPAGESSAGLQADLPVVVVTDRAHTLACARAAPAVLNRGR
jgi:hypothetical protein